MKKIILSVILCLNSTTSLAGDDSVINVRNIDGNNYKCRMDSENSFEELQYWDRERLETPRITIVYDGVLIPKEEHYKYKMGNIIRSYEGYFKSRRLPSIRKNFGTIGVLGEVCVLMSPETNQKA